MVSRKRNEDEPEPWKNAKLTNDEMPPSSELEQKKLVLLNPADCDPDFIIEGDGLQGSSLYEQGFAYCWSGARANVGITGGKYCFGCKVVSFQLVEMEDTGPNQQNLCRVGISRGDDVVGSLGETSRSFGYEGTGKFLNAIKRSDYGEKFGVGDIIICAVNLEEKPLASISFSKNGKCLGTAMKFNAGPLGLAVVDSQVKNLQWESAVFPHVVLKNVGVELQFSVEDGLVPEEGFKPWASALEDGNAIAGPVFDELTDCEVMMMVGMPSSGKTTWAEKWVKEHPEKRYVVLGTEMVLSRMKVPPHWLKWNCGEPQRLESLINRAGEVVDTLLSREVTTPRNYIIDEANVEKQFRKLNLGRFNLFKKIAVVVFPSPEKLKDRFMKRCGELGVQDVSAAVPVEMLAEYVLPVSKDMPGSDELFDEVMFVELNREESQRDLDEMKQEVSNWNSNNSSVYSCGNSVQSDPFSPNYGKSPVWPYPIPSAVNTGSWSIPHLSIPPDYQDHMLNQVNTYQAHQGAVPVKNPFSTNIISFLVSMGSKGKRNEDKPEPWKNAKLTDDEMPPSSELEQKKLVLLNPADCDPDFIIEGDGLQGSSLYEQEFAYCWSGARANVGITGGKYCFGCKVVLFQAVKMEDTGPNQQNLCRVGISRGDDVVGSLGETSRSFGYGSTGKFLNASKLSDYGEMFGVGDIIICAVNLEEKPLASVSFSKNGKRLGTAMKFNAGPLGLAVVDSQVKNLQWESAVFPHVVLKNVGVELQFSVEDGLVPEEGFKPWASALEDGNAIAGPVFDEPTDCEVMIMVGMSGSGKTTWAEKWVKEHPEKRYVLLGTEEVVDRMKVPRPLLRRNFSEEQHLERVLNRSSKIVCTLLSRAGTTPRNYIVDEAHLSMEIRKWDLQPFNLFKKIAVVVFPSPEKANARFMKRCEGLGMGEVSPDIMNEMWANYVLPVSKDMPGSDELFDEVMFVELNRVESQRRLDEMKLEVHNLNSMNSYCINCGYPFSPNYG